MFLAFWAWIAIAFCPPPAWAKYSPSIEWETVRTPHFRVHYPPTHRRFAAYLTAYLEEAYAVLSRDLHWELAEPAEVVVRGDTDIPNGFSSVFPMNRLIVDAVPFSAVGTIGEYDNWIRTLAYHELTHMVANDTTTGIFKTLRSIFGSVAKVNPYQPQWLVEGLAVYEETTHSIYGRGRSAFVDMVLRTAARDGLLEGPGADDPFVGVTLDRLNDGVPVWPGPVTSYFYGYVLQEMLVEAGGPAAPGELSLRSGGEVPFFINTLAEQVLHTDYYALWDKAVARLKSIADDDLAAIRAQPVTPLHMLTSIGRQSGGIASASDGSRVYLIRDSYSQGPGISAVDPASGKVQRLTDWYWGGGNQLRQKDGFLLYSRYEPFEEYKLYSDIFLWDVKKEREIRLTEGARAQDADFSPDFEWRDGALRAGSVVYVKNLDDANQALVIWDGKRERVLYRGQRFERIASPAWGRGPARAWIVFTLKVNGANERLLAVDAASGAVRTITHHPSPSLRVNELTPSWTSGGDLLFSGSDTGVFNLYRYPWSRLQPALVGGTPGAPQRLSNVETGLIFPIEWPIASGSAHPRLLAMAYGSRGFDLAELPEELHVQGARHRALRPLHQKLHPSGFPGEPEVAPDPEDVQVDWPDPLEDHPEGTPESYSAFPALWPKFWFPYAQKVSDGWTAGLSTSGEDALELHQYSISAAWDSRATFPLYDVRYQYDGLYPSIQLERLQENKYLGLFGASNLSDTTTLTLSYPVGFWQVSFGGTFVESRFFGDSADSGGVQASFAHGKVDVYPDSIDRDAGEAGHRAQVTLTGFFSGGDQFASVEGRWEQRIPSFWRQHFFRFYASAAHSTNPVLSQLYFVGGGESSVTSLQDYLVRGYEPGAIFGRDIATFDFEYWIPLKDVFRGHGTLPAFYERAKLKLFVDTGSAEYVAGEPDRFSKWPVGAGVELLQDVRLLYRVPLTLGLGFDWGLDSSLGGEKQIVFGIMSRVN